MVLDTASAICGKKLQPAKGEAGENGMAPGMGEEVGKVALWLPMGRPTLNGGVGEPR